MNEEHPAVSDVYEIVAGNATFKAPAAAEERIRQMLKVKHAEMVAGERAEVGAGVPTENAAEHKHSASMEKEVSEHNKSEVGHIAAGHQESKPESKPEYKHNNNLNNMNFFNFFKSHKWAYGLVALLILAMGTFGSYPLIPAPSVQGYSVKNAVKDTPYNAPLKIVFSQPMNRKSVEKAFRVTPNLPGEFEWKYNTLLYKPTNEPKIGDQYTVTISTEAKSLIGKNLEIEYQEVFKIVGAPKVVFYTPAGSDDVTKDAKITVMFNQPVLKLTTIEESEKNIPAISITPNLAGRWKWLGTSALQFEPEELALATTYTVKIPAGIKTANEGVTDEDTEFSFNTLRPKLDSVYPSSYIEKNQPSNSNGNYTGSVRVNSYNSNQTHGPDQKLILAFNQKVDAKSFNELFALYVNDKEVKYSADYLSYKDWLKNEGIYDEESYDSSNETERQKERRMSAVIVKSSNNYPLNSQITYKLQKGIKSTEGDLTMDDDFNGGFLTAKPLEITGFESRQGYSRIYFNNPVKSSELKKYIRITPVKKGAEIEIDFGNDDEGNEHYIDYAFEPATKYTVSIAKEIKDIFAQTLKEDYSNEFTTPELSPYVEVRSNQYMNVLDYNLDPSFYIKSANVDLLELTLTKVPNNEMREALNNNAFSFSTEGEINQIESAGGKVYKWTKNLDSTPNKNIFTKIDLNKELNTKLSPGIYYFYFHSPARDLGKYNRTKLFVLSKTAIAYKLSGGKAIIWATDINSGEPVKGMEISTTSGEEISAITDAEGIAELTLISKDSNNYYGGFIGEKNGDVALVYSDWSEGVNAWDFNINYDYERKQNYVYLYTERPIYRPGDTVYFKGIIRNDSGLRLNLPKEQTVKVKIEDANYKNIYEKDLKISKNGTINDEIKIDAKAATGTYRIQVIAGNGGWQNTFSTSFSIAEYRKPDYKVSLNKSEKSYTNGDTMEVEIKGEYFFGSPITNAPVEINLTKQDYYFNEYQDDWYNFSTNDYVCFWECPSGGTEFIKTVNSELDSLGVYNFQYKPTIKKDETSQIYNLEATVTDISQQQISNRVYIAVHKGEYYTGIKPAEYVYKNGDPIGAKLITVDREGNPVSGKKVTVVLAKREWNSVKKQNVDGYYYYENSYEDTDIDKETIFTKSDGKGDVTFAGVEEGGVYVLKAESRDAKGNTIQSSGTVYISSYDYISWGRENNDRIELVPDKLEYKTGDTAKILVKSPYAGVKALVTIERAEILERKIIDIQSNSHTIEIPIKDEYLPNVYVSVLLVKGSWAKKLSDVSKDDVSKQMYEKENEVQFLTDQIDENLKKYANPTELDEVNEPLQAKLRQANNDVAELIQLKADMEEQDKNLKIHSSNEDGLASFKLGYTELKVNTAEKKLAINMAANKERYLPGEEVTVQIDAKDISGNPVSAEISVSVVDESVLSLKEDVINDLLGYFYQRRNLGVKTAHSLTKLLNRVNVQVESGLKGGGGGLAQKKRADFRDTAYWHADVQTDSNGKATVKFKLPDNLTTWQVLAIGVTKDTKVGSKKIDFLATKDLLLRPVTPRFLTIDDELEIGLISHSYLENKMNARVTLVGEGVEIKDDAAQKTVIYKGEESQTMWKIKVKNADKAKLIFKVEDTGASGARDEVEITLPVYPFSYPEFVATSGTVPADKTSVAEYVFLPEGIDYDLGSINVSIAATFAGSLADGIETLVRYPYGCAEQTASSLLPNLAVKQVLNLPNIDNNLVNDADLAEKVDLGLQKLYKYQQASGGFGIWADSEATVYLTSYILQTLDEAKRAGYQVDAAVMEKAKKYILDKFYTGTDENSRAYALFVLADAGSPQVALMNNLYDQKSKLNLTGKAYLGLALAGSNKTKAKDLADDILAYQNVTVRGVSFNEDAPSYRIFDSNAKLNAAVLRLLTRIDVNHPLLDKMLREIRHERTNARWTNTHASSQTLLAMVEYLTKSHEFESEYFAKVIVNGGTKMDTAFFKKENFGEVKNIAVEMVNLLRDNQENEIMITRSGTGKVYYDILMEYFLPLEKQVPREEGFAITHSYYAMDDKDEVAPLKVLPFGETIKGRISIVVPDDRHYVLVEDRLPAALEAIDFSLKTSKKSLTDGDSYSWRNRWWYFNHTEFRDDRVAYFADYLPKGVYELTYYARVTSKGEFADLPVRIEEMYMPEVFGRTWGQKVLAR